MKKELKINAFLTEKSIEDDDGSITIRGYASTYNKDRTGDVIAREAWTKGGLTNYLKNPVVLAFHNHAQPVGKTTAWSVTETGLEIVAKISKSATNIVQLIADEVLKAFSVSVLIKDAEYDSEADIFVIKDLELLEISVVSVPANQDSLFSVEKSFENHADYVNFKNQYTSKSIVNEDISRTKKVEEHMDPVELEKLIASTLQGEMSKQKALEEEAKRKAAEEVARKEEMARVAAEAATIVVKSQAEALVADLRKAQEESAAEFSKKVAELQDEIVSKSEEISRITRQQTRRPEFADRSGNADLSPELAKDVTDAVFLSKILEKCVENTTFGKKVLEKAANASSSFAVYGDNWEQLLENRLEQDIRLELKVANLFREIQLQSARQIVSINTEAGVRADWVTASEVSGSTRTSATTDPEVTKTLGELTLSTSKLAGKAFLTLETEEDAIVPILPLIYEDLARAHALTVEWALLNNDSTSNAGSSSTAFADGLVKRSATLSTGVPATGALEVKHNDATQKFTADHVLAARRKMGRYALDPNNIVGILSVDAWYDLLEDPEFADINTVGAQAQKITGVVGRLYGIDFIVSPELPAKAASAAAIVLVNPRNFVIPRLRGMTVETEYSAILQRRAIVATQRLGFSHLIASAPAVSVVTYSS